MANYKPIPSFSEAAQATFWSYVDRVNGPCWRWADLGAGAYGVFRGFKAHRVAFTLMRGPVPNGLTLDHVCGNTWCVNPEHLDPVTQRANTLRGGAQSAINARKTVCAKGHVFELRVDGLGRVCRTCQDAWNRANWTKPDRYRNRRKRGLCLECNTPSAKVRCDIHRARHNERNKGRPR